MLTPLSGALAAQNEANGIGSVVIGVVKKLAVPVAKYVTRTVCQKLGENSDPYNDNIFRSVGELMATQRQRFEEVKEMLVDIEGQLDDMEIAIQESIANLMLYEQATDVSAYAKLISDLESKYLTVMNSFQNYAVASGDYCQALEAYNADKTPENEAALAAAQENVGAKYEYMKAILPAPKELLEDIDDLAKYACTRYPVYTDDLSRGITSGFTYQDMVYSFSKTKHAFEHQHYTAITGAMNDIAAALYLMSQTALVTSQQLIYEDALEPVSEQMLANAVYACSDAVNDIAEQYDDELNSFMRPYDKDYSLEFDYVKSETHKYEVYRPIDVGEILDTMTLTTKINASATKQFMNVERGIVNGDMYAMLSADHNLLIKHMAVFSHAAQDIDAYLQNRDYFNILRSKDGKYTVGKYSDDYLSLINTEAFKLSGGDLRTYLDDQGGFEHVPETYHLRLVTSNVPTPRLDLKLFDTDVANFCFYWLKTTSINGKFDDDAITASDATDNGNLALVLLKAKADDISSRIKLTREGEGSAELLRESGGEWKSFSGDSIQAQTLMRVAVTETSAPLKSLRLLDSSGKELAFIADQGLFAVMKDENGRAEFEFVAPYQSFIVEAVFGEAEQTAQLVSVANIDLDPNSLVEGAELRLEPTILPLDATNRKIVWSIENDGGTGATLRDNVISALKAGEITLKATIKNGSGYFEDFETRFSINVNIENGWYQKYGNWYCYKDGAPLSGLCETAGYITGSEKAAGKTYAYYFGENGIMQTGWVKIGSKWMYFGESGSSPLTSRLGRQARYGVSQAIGNKGERHYYLFSGTGAMKTGVYTINGVPTTFCKTGSDPRTDLLGARV